MWAGWEQPALREDGWEKVDVTVPLYAQGVGLSDAPPSLQSTGFGDPPPHWTEELRSLADVETVAAHDHVFRIASRNGPATTMALMDAAGRAGVPVHSLSVQSTTLDDVFVHYTGRQLRDALQQADPLERGMVPQRG